MDVESSAANGKEKSNRTAAAGGGSGRNKKRMIWLLWVVILVMVILLGLILGLTVFKPMKPVTTVNSVSLHDFQVSLDGARFRLSINVTLDARVTVKNPNRVRFTYGNSTAFLNYRGDVVGEAPFPQGKIPAGGTAPMNISLSIGADRLLSNSTFYSDVVSGSLPLSTYTRISGKVSIMGVTIPVVSYTTCDLTLSVSTRTISNYHCTYKTKL
ncbi:Late embryogenesis abundant protein, LEA_2 subgroup [Dillenia turbinata]|uniref:Late embryogenesis abundant protein, LEA_2 subgroup n=1 Tax=Dillenia turbinata TaxID=194707 RepID=A0AAN8W7K3_9MAGN